MISVESLQATLTGLLGAATPNQFPFKIVARNLHKQELELGIDLSAYGYLMYAIDHYGPGILYKNILASNKAVIGYASEAQKYRDDMPVMLINASKYVEHIFGLIPDPDACFQKLEGMTFPYVLYVLFAGGGQEQVVQKYRPEFEEQLRRYPSTLDLLPESYKKAGREVLNADIE